jgi:drug/metabolite transporter (DMT)-like permease
MSNTALYLITVLIWGSTWLAIEFQLGVVPPEVSVVYRYLIASFLLFFYCGINRLNLKFNLISHLWFALLGSFLFCLNYVFAYRAQVHITSALAAILFSSMVWMNIVLSRVVFRTKAGARVLLGAVLGIAGIVTLFAPQVSQISLSDSVFYGSMLALLGALSGSIGNIVSQASQQRRSLPVFQGNAWAMLYGAVITASIALVQGHEFTFDATFTYIASLLYLAVFGSIIAFGAYLTLLGKIGAHRAGYAAVMFPVVALLLSVLFEGLRIDWSIVVGTVLVLFGNTLVLKRRS